MAAAQLTHYQVLRLPVSAPPSVVKKAYHQAAKQQHPDKGSRSVPLCSALSLSLCSVLRVLDSHTHAAGGSAEQFQRLQEAYVPALPWPRFPPPAPHRRTELCVLTRVVAIVATRC